MDPLRVLPGEPPSAGEQAQPQPRNSAARWRQELERAQWALRARQAAVAPAPSARGEAAASPQASPRAPVLPPAHRSEGSPAASPGRPVSPPGSASTPAPERSSSQARGAEAPRGPAAALASSSRAPEAPRPTASAAGQPPAVPERFTWPRTHVHVMARDGAAYVWVRDGALDESERRRLATQLAARMRASGVRLARLAVNGEEILNLEGVASWQSKQ